MAKIYPHKRLGWRIRYTVFYPDGSYRDGERAAKRKRLSDEIYRDADALERLTRAGVIKSEEATYYLNTGFITKEEYTLLTGLRPTVEISWDELKSLWMDYFKKRSRPGTYDAYLAKLRPIMALLSKNSVPATTIETLEEYQAQRLRGMESEYPEEVIKPVTPATVNRDFQIIRAMLDLAVKAGAIKENPARKVKDLRESGGRIPRALYDDEIKSFFRTLHDNKHLCYGLVVDIVLMALYTGLRMGEILNLPKANIKLSERIILIQAHGKGETYWRPKSRKGTRAMPIHKDLAPIVEKHLAVEGPYLFGQRSGEDWTPLLRTNTVSHAVKKIMQEAGLPGDISFHCLRHSFVSYVMQGGASLPQTQYLAGHEDIETTMRYTHVLPTEASPVDNLPSFVSIFEKAGMETKAEGRVESRTGAKTENKKRVKKVPRKVPQK